ncbi:MAG: hypothetical protein IKU14_04705, partial [Rhodocyclaceae bacterium]|nr:hypothetical protein [Rhodocyclaceae bacterium]
PAAHTTSSQRLNARFLPHNDFQSNAIRICAGWRFFAFARYNKQAAKAWYGTACDAGLQQCCDNYRKLSAAGF